LRWKPDITLDADKSRVADTTIAKKVVGIYGGLEFLEKMQNVESSPRR
jgi:hypothetical protein